MALSITHQFVSAIPDGGNASLVQPSNWNATHTIAGLGTNVQTFLETPSSANLAAALTDKTGTGVSVFGTSPTITTQLSINGGSGAAILSSDAADILALRNGTNGQQFNVYNTFTDASNYERIAITWSFSQVYLITQGAGTGVARDIIIGADSASTTPLIIRLGGVNAWHFDGNKFLLANTDNAYDIGASGANRPRTIYAATSVITAALRIDQAPTAVGTGTKTISNAADSSTNFGHYFSVNLNGTTYFIPCSATAPT